MSHIDLVGMTPISQNLYHAAQLLKQGAHRYVDSGSAFQHSHFVIPAIFMYHALLDSFFNEQLALSISKIEDTDGETDLSKRCKSIISKTFNESKINEILSIYGVDTITESLRTEIILLIDLRDILYHFEAEMAPTGLYPYVIDRFIETAGLVRINTGWVSAISVVETLDWVDKKVREFLEEFCRLVGTVSPYTHAEVGKPPSDPTGWESSWHSIRKKIEAKNDD